eukprot:1201397-Pyramimonas_sp.AAC.1
MEADDELDDPEYIYVIEDDLWEVHEEADVTTALASYQAVRESLRIETNKRGFGKGKQKGKGKDSDAPPPPAARFGNSNKCQDCQGRKVRARIDVIKLRAKCARCGQVGHLARERVNPPDA